MICTKRPYVNPQVNLHPKHGLVEKIKDDIQLWLLIEEVCNSTLPINPVAQRALKACLSLGNIYGENMELAKYYEVFLARAKVALERVLISLASHW